MSIALCIGELIFYDVAELEQYHVMKFWIVPMYTLSIPKMI